MQHGLLRPSFVPPAPQRALRDLTRHRSSFVQGRAALVNRVQKVLEGANIKLACVASDVMGVSARAMLDALVAGEEDPALLAELAKGRMRPKRDLLERALRGRVQAHQRFILSELLCQIDGLDETLARFDAQIQAACAPYEQAVALLDTIPGVARATAELIRTIIGMIVSEIGTDMTRFPTPGHLSAWAGVAPGNHESAGKRLSGRVRAGNRLPRAGLVQAAHAAAHTRDTYLSAQFHRLAGRRGTKKALMAVAHSILVIAYRLIERKTEYEDLGANYFDPRRPQAAARRLVGRLETLGYEVTLAPAVATA